MIVKNINIDNENEKVDLTIQFDFLEFQDFRYILEHNVFASYEFERVNIEFLDHTAEDGIGKNEEALILMAPPMKKDKKERLDKFCNNLYQFCHISFPYKEEYFI